MNCDWCGKDTNVTCYKVIGKANDLPHESTIHICDCCNAWGVLSENWYGFSERIRDLTDIDFDYDDEGNLLVEIK